MQKAATYAPKGDLKAAAPPILSDGKKQEEEKEKGSQRDQKRKREREKEKRA